MGVHCQFLENPCQRVGSGIMTSSQNIHYICCTFSIILVARVAHDQVNDGSLCRFLQILVGLDNVKAKFMEFLRGQESPAALWNEWAKQLAKGVCGCLELLLYYLLQPPHLHNYTLNRLLAPMVPRISMMNHHNSQCRMFTMINTQQHNRHIVLP